MKASSPLRRRLLWAGLVTLALTLSTALFGYCALTSRPDGDPSHARTVTIARGASREDIVASLEAAGLAPFPWLTTLAFRATGTFGRIGAGTHELPATSHTLELIEYFKSEAAAGHTVWTVVPGRSIWQYARVLEGLGVGTEAEVVALASDSAFAQRLGLPLAGPRPDPTRPAATLLEGYLYPETYHLSLRESLEGALTRAARQFLKVWSELKTTHATSYAAVVATYGLTDHELIILASLVEKEVAAHEEAPTVAGVFYNRLRDGWKLETDPTLMYRADRVGHAPSPVERRDATNPYNTYAFNGLPPGPIASPGRQALEAVLNPASHEFMFFVARQDGTGRHVFSKTMAEHEENIDIYLRRKATPAP